VERSGAGVGGAPLRPFLGSGGQAQGAYEVLRAEALGEAPRPVVHPALRERWERFGLPGLLSSEELVGCRCEPIRRIDLQGAPHTSQALRTLDEVYRVLIERSVGNGKSSRGEDTGHSAAGRDLCAGLHPEAAEAGHY